MEEGLETDASAGASSIQAVSILADLQTSYPADVLLFHPEDASVFLVGTYLLDETTRLRHGRICIYRLSTDACVADRTPKDGAELISETQCDAILDMKWYKSLLYVAHSTGSLSIYEWPSSSQSDTKLILKDRKTVFEANVLIMSISVSSHGVLASNSDGTVSTLTLNLWPLARWAVSDLEVWTQARSEDGNLVYSGSDDGVFSSWDWREVCHVDEPTPTFRNRRSHGAGVTAILPYRDNTILTGSYDDHIRRFDLRDTRRAVQEENLGGGVWRIIPRSRNELVACCMYDGAKVIDDQDFQVVKEWKGHESMVYGGDVAANHIGTCSFYDKRVFIWK